MKGEMIIYLLVLLCMFLVNAAIWLALWRTP